MHITLLSHARGDNRRSRAKRGTTPANRQAPRPAYLTLLSGAFALFNAARIVAYLPMIWAIHTSGDASQHSLWAWITWTGANATMAAWLYEHTGQRVDIAVAVNLGNAIMCLLTALLIVGYRW